MEVYRSCISDRAYARPQIHRSESPEPAVPHAIEEKAVIEFIFEMSDLGTPIRNKFMTSIALNVTRHRPEADRPVREPNKNWTKVFERKHPELRTRRAEKLNWKRHDKNTYSKVEHWFDVIGEVLSDEAILAGCSLC